MRVILCLHYAAKPYWCGTTRYGTAKETCVNSALSLCTVPYRSQRVRSKQQVWCSTLRYGTSKYSHVNIHVVGRMWFLCKLCARVITCTSSRIVLMTHTCVCQRTYRFTLALRRVTNYGPVDRRRNAEVNRDME